MDIVLITGGAGFIGSHLAEQLYRAGYKIRLYDNLSEQVHGPNADWPEYLRHESIELIQGDVCDRDALAHAMDGVSTVVHLASETGVGQSMYEIEKYVRTNIQGTAVLLDLLTQKKNQVKKVVLSSSRAVYGEGKYNCEQCGVVYPRQRETEQLKREQWELKCPLCGRQVSPVPTDENSLPSPTSIYAITKLTQEQLLANFGETHIIPYAILRYQNVYGPRQSLNNPYTGILSIFSSRILNGNQILVFEDGKESRDFVFIDDVVRATILAIENQEVTKGIFNVGTGKPTTVMEIATILCDKLGADKKPKIVSKSRIGDIRHCYADLAHASKALGYEPKYDVEPGLTRFIEWVVSENCPVDMSHRMLDELINRNMFIGTGESE